MIGCPPFTKNTFELNGFCIPPGNGHSMVAEMSILRVLDSHLYQWQIDPYGLQQELLCPSVNSKGT